VNVITSYYVWGRNAAYHLHCRFRCGIAIKCVVCVMNFVICVSSFVVTVLMQTRDIVYL